METLFFENIKTKKRYKVVSFAENAITLEDAEGRQWEEPYSKDKFKKLGYTLVRESATEDEE